MILKFGYHFSRDSFQGRNLKNPSTAAAAIKSQSWTYRVILPFPPPKIRRICRLPLFLPPCSVLCSSIMKSSGDYETGREGGACICDIFDTPPSPSSTSIALLVSKICPFLDSLDSPLSANVIFVCPARPPRSASTEEERTKGSSVGNERVRKSSGRANCVRKTLPVRNTRRLQENSTF